MIDNKIKKSIIYNSIGSAVYLFCQWLITFVVVWISGYETAGILSIAMSVSTTFCVIATFNMRNYQASDINGKYSEKTYLISRAVTSIVAVVITLIYSIIKNFSLFQILCINVYMFFKISEALVDILHGSIQKKWRFDIIGISYFIRGILSIVLFFIGLYFTNNLLIAIALMTLGVYIFILLYDVKKYKSEFKEYGNFKKIYLLQLLMQCAPLVLYGLVFSYVSMYPRITAEQIYGTKMLGYYASVATPALIIQVAATFIFNPLISLFADYYNKKDFRRFNITMWKILILILLFGFSGLIVSHFIAPCGLKILFGKEILNYAYLFGGVIVVSTLTAIIWFMGMILIVIRNYKILLSGSLFTLIAVYILTPILIGKYGLNGINITLIICYILQIVIYLFFITNLKKRKICKGNKIYYLRSTSIINDSRASKEIVSLLNNKYDVFVLGWDRDKKIKNYKKIIINSKKIDSKYFKFKAGYGKSVVNILGLLFFQVWLLLMLIKDNKKYSCIHACDFDCGFVSLIICQLFNKKLVYDMYDYYSDSRPMSIKIEKIVNKMENMVIDNSDVSIICGEWRKQQISNTKPKRIAVIHNTPDINHVCSKKILKSSSRKIKLVYVGILQEDRLLLEVINKIKDDDNYEIHVGGFGQHEKYIEKISEKYKNIYFYGSLRYEEVLSLEKDCDVLFATYNPKIKNHRFSAPNKVYEAMALGKPIIVCKNTGIDKLVKDNEIGLTINYDGNDFMRSLKMLSTNRCKLREMGSKAKNLYDEKYNWHVMELRLADIYKQIFDNNE